MTIKLDVIPPKSTFNLFGMKIIIQKKSNAYCRIYSDMIIQNNILFQATAKS